MPMLKEMVEHIRRDGFRFGENVLLFGVQHLMRQSLALCWALNTLGIRYENMFLAGKPYSSDPETLSFLGRLGVILPAQRRYRLAVSQSSELVTDLRTLSALVACRKASATNPVVLVLDDGGHALSGVESWLAPPFRIAGVEQTASGFRQTGITTMSFASVDVGTSAVKRRCEPSMIIEAALSRVDQLIATARVQTVGIIGLGYVGLALHRHLESQGIHPIVFDERSDAYPDVLPGQRARRVHELFDRCDLIFGCTGSDVTVNLADEVLRRGLASKSRTLISLSSGDDEFFALKTALIGASEASYEIADIPTVSGEQFNSRFELPRNGFPINFDNSGESAPLEQIQGTICALVGALCQARYLSAMPPVPRRVTLDIALQRWLFDRWLEYLPGAPDGARSLQVSLAEKESEPRFEPKGATMKPVFGNWTGELRA
jgi:hypothetical protein